MPADVAAVVVFVAVVVVVGVVAVRLGMLIAPRLDRLTDSADEDERADD